MDNKKFIVPIFPPKRLKKKILEAIKKNKNKKRPQ
jgi:predicted RNA binding protein YcfA (HicA-like mRNA interferase family)